VASNRTLALMLQERTSLGGLPVEMNAWTSITVSVDVDRVSVFINHRLAGMANLTTSALRVASNSTLRTGCAAEAILISSASAELVTGRAFDQDVTVWSLFAISVLSNTGVGLLRQGIIELDGRDDKMVATRVPAASHGTFSITTTGTPGNIAVAAQLVPN